MQTFEVSHTSVKDSQATRPNPLFHSAIFIIVTEFCERVAYYGFAGSVVLFFQEELDMSNAEADVQFNVWSGMAYCAPLIGGFIADKYLGRYWTIILFSSMYVLGLIIIVCGADPENINRATFFAGMYIVALGTGGIKPNVSTLGADQYDDRFESERKGKESFFNYFYWSINLGACFSFTFVAYVCQYGLPGLGGKKYSFVAGYTFPAIMMALAVAIFVYGTPRYSNIAMPKDGQGSMLEESVKVCYEALWTRRDSYDGKRFQHRLDAASIVNGGSYKPNEVARVKLLARASPFLFPMIMFWGIYSQMSTAFQNQGCQMDVNLGDMQIPVSTLQMFDTISILVFVPIFDIWLLPWLERKGYHMTMLGKIALGFIFAAAAMVVAAFVETGRRANARDEGDYFDKSAREHASACIDIDDFNPYEYQKWYAGDSDHEPYNCRKTCGDKDDEKLLSLDCIECDKIPQQSKVNILAQIPQFMLIGIAEIFSSISSLEFFYSQAPSSMRSVTQSVNLFTTALGTWMVIPLIYIVNSGDKPWVPDDVDKGALDAYFFLLAALMGLNTVYVRYLTKGYKYVSMEELEALEADSSDSEGSGRSSGSDGTSEAYNTTNPLVKGMAS